MNAYRRYLQPLFFSKRFYWSLASLILLFILAYVSAALFLIARVITGIFAILLLIDYLALFIKRDGITATRHAADRFSNGDDNPVQIRAVNHYSFKTSVKIIDELPVQFQLRGFVLGAELPAGESRELGYSLRPTTRGEYLFFNLNLFAASPLNLVVRRFTVDARQTVKVYPSYLSLRKYELLAWSNRLADAGTRRVRKTGQSVEFEEIREYVSGDDIRTINWKATARKGGQLMVNNYADERSQQVYCIIDKGRVMKMPFNGMTLLDYAINSALILSRVVLLRQDRAGLVSFGTNIGQIIPADKRAGQITQIMETLYDQQTQFGESDFEKLHALVSTRITQRSLLVLYTNFESLSGLQRQLPYIRGLARTHLVLVIFFENTELRRVSESPATDIETLYIRTIAEKFAHEKRLMVRELQQHGILSILTAPENLTVNAVNKYLEVKARQEI